MLGIRIHNATSIKYQNTPLIFREFVEYMFDFLLRLPYCSVLSCPVVDLLLSLSYRYDTAAFAYFKWLTIDYCDLSKCESFWGYANTICLDYLAWPGANAGIIYGGGFEKM